MLKISNWVLLLLVVCTAAFPCLIKPTHGHHSVCVCAHVCMRAAMYMCLCMYTCMYMYTHVGTYMCMYLCMYICVCVCIWMLLCVFVCLCAFVLFIFVSVLCMQGLSLYPEEGMIVHSKHKIITEFTSIKLKQPIADWISCRWEN